MGSLLLREKWPRQGHGRLCRLFARRAAAWGGHGLAPACTWAPLTAAVAPAPSQQMATEWISLANSSFD